jgi:hypothetical protein
MSPVSTRASPLPQAWRWAMDCHTPDATKPALGGFCFASYLVGRGNLNPLSKLLIYNINIEFYF